MFPGAIASLIAGGLFVSLLAVAAHGDLRTRRIPNRLVLVLLVVGLVASATVLAQPVGVRGALLGVLTGFALWLPLWLLGALGAGDVKLAAACGAWLGPWGIVNASLLAMLAGGVLALSVLVQRRTLGLLPLTAALWAVSLRRDTRQALVHPAQATGIGGTPLLPYGVALAVGAVLAGWLPASWLPLAALR